MKIGDMFNFRNQSYSLSGEKFLNLAKSLNPESFILLISTHLTLSLKPTTRI